MIHSLNNIQPKEVFPGFIGKFVHSDNMTFAYWEIKKGSAFPERSHVQEKVVNMLEGEFEITLEGTPNHLCTNRLQNIGCILPSAGRS